MNKTATKKGGPRKYNLNFANQNQKGTQKIKIVVNDYSYFPPPESNDPMVDIRKWQREKINQIIKENNLDLNKDKDIKKMNALLNEATDEFNRNSKLQEQQKNQVVDLEGEDPLVIFNIPIPYFSLSQFVSHHYFCVGFNEMLIEKQRSSKSPNQKIEHLIPLNFFRNGIKMLIKTWHDLIPQVKSLLTNFLNSNFYSRKESAIWAGLMRDKPILPILGSLMDLWFYPMLGYVKEPDLDGDAFLSLTKRAWKMEKLITQELLNKNVDSVINGIVKAKSKIKLTYPLPKFASIELHLTTLQENRAKIKDDSFGQAIFDVISDGPKFPPRLSLSLGRFGAVCENIEEFIENLFEDRPHINLLPGEDKKIQAFIIDLKKLKTFFREYREKIIYALVNKQEPYYDLLTFVLEHLTIRPALPGLIYWSKIENVPHLEKLLSLALKIEISYLETITKLSLANFTSWFKTTKYEN